MIYLKGNYCKLYDRRIKEEKNGKVRNFCW